MKRLLIGLLTMVALTACGSGAVTEPHTAPAPAQDVAPAPVIAPVPVSTPAQPTEPTRLRLEGLAEQIAAPVIPLVLTGTELTPPNDPTVLGWWGRPAGAAHGVTLLVGHTVHTGGGTLDDLEDVPVGSTANVSGVRYEVASVKIISKDKLAKQAQVLFRQSGPQRLVIVTCEGYDAATGHYDSNVVLTATRTN